MNTPTPWEVDYDGPSNPIIVHKDSAAVIAHVKNARYEPGEVEANARIIAAAPDLLAALKRFAENDHPCNGRHDCLHCNAMDVIERAEGKAKV